MPEVNQYALTNRELLELLIKHIGVHDGRWALLANFGVAVGSFGPSPEQQGPGLAMTLTGAGLQRAGPEVPDGPLVIDAAKFNPEKKDATKSNPARKKASST